MLADASALADLAGAQGISLPALNGSASVVFDGAADIAFEGIEGNSAGIRSRGSLALTRRGEALDAAGSLELEAIDVAGWSVRWQDRRRCSRAAGCGRKGR